MFSLKADANLVGNQSEVGVAPEIIDDMAEGDHVLIDDGKVLLLVESKTDDAVHCRALRGGVISNKKGVNLPILLTLSPLSDKDYEDAKVGIEAGVEYIALSFVSSAQDVQTRTFLDQNNGDRIHIISKIERMSAVDHLEEIVDVSDVIMVARGDLGVEIGVEKVPATQKYIIRTANRFVKPVIVATHMLETMIDKRTATRAEVSDVANAIYDRCDAVMLSVKPVVLIRLMQWRRCVRFVKQRMLNWLNAR